MVNSGERLASDCMTAYTKLQSGKKELRYLILGFNDDYSVIEVKEVGQRTETFQDMLQKIPKDRARYVFYDCNYKNKEGQERNKILFAIWSSDEDAPLKEKMLVSSSANQVAKRCKGFAKKAEFHSWSELTEENFVIEVSKN